MAVKVRTSVFSIYVLNNSFVLGVANYQDDEYLWAGTEDPRVVITTSRSPSSKLKEFAKELRFLIPNAAKINRGNYLNKNLLEACLAKQVCEFLTHLILFTEKSQ